MPSLKNIRYPLKNFVPRCAYPLYCACMLSCSTVSDSLWPHEPLSMGFPRQEYQSELPFPSPGYLPNPVIKPMSLALVGWFFSADPPGKPLFTISGMRIKFQCLFSLIFFFSQELPWLHLKTCVPAIWDTWVSFLHAVITRPIPQTGYRILHSLIKVFTRVYHGGCLEEVSRLLPLT